MSNQITDGPTDEAKKQSDDKFTSWIEWVVNMSEEIAHLKAEKLALQAHITKQDEQIDKLAQDNARLTHLCKQYAWHHDACNIRNDELKSCECGYTQALAATDSPAPTQTKEQAVIQILTEALKGVRSYTSHETIIRGIIDDALTCADAAGKREK